VGVPPTTPTQASEVPDPTTAGIPARKDKKVVLTTFSVLADMAQNVAGDKAIVDSVKGTGKPDYEVVSQQIKTLATGNDTTEIQLMLAAQAVTLQAVFNFEMMRLGNCKNPEQTEAIFSRAVRAQEQCRRTLATLGA
jgi:hypothetical protein